MLNYGNNSESPTFRSQFNRHTNQAETETDFALREIHGNKQFEWGFGRNLNGELSLGVEKNALVPACAVGLGDVSTRQIASSANHTVLVSTGGALYCSGSRISGKSGKKTNT